MKKDSQVHLTMINR